MRRRYCSPVAVGICIETFVVASSSAAARIVEKPVQDDSGIQRGIWGSLWK